MPRAGLRERVERLGLEFFDVDLRWGVEGHPTARPEEHVGH